MPRAEDDQLRGGGPPDVRLPHAVAADETAACDRLRLVPTTTLGWPAAWTGISPGSLSTCARAAGRLRRGSPGGHGRADGRPGHRPGRPQVPVRRPRVRTVGDEHELTLASYDSFVSADLLADGGSQDAGLAVDPVGWDPPTPASRRSRRVPHAQRSRAGSWPRRPSGWTSCCTGRWTASGGW
jgi:hypothetical protein